jgi:hypothetical protein
MKEYEIAASGRSSVGPIDYARPDVGCSPSNAEPPAERVSDTKSVLTGCLTVYTLILVPVFALMLLSLLSLVIWIGSFYVARKL